MSAKRLALPVRRSLALTEDAHDRLRAPNTRCGPGNNYLMVVLPERRDDYADPDRPEAVLRDFIDEYGAPRPREET